jgi:hypothetical protein
LLVTAAYKDRIACRCREATSAPAVAGTLLALAKSLMAQRIPRPEFFNRP